MVNIRIIQTLLLGVVLACTACKSSVLFKKEINIRFLDEYIVTETQKFEGSVIGGLSGIDYQSSTNSYFIVCDDAINPRYYKAKINIANRKIQSVNFDSVIYLKPKETQDSLILDLESVRIFDDKLLFASEGSIKYQKNPVIFEKSFLKSHFNFYKLPDYFSADSTLINYPRHNGVFESIAVYPNQKGFWVATELPLKGDGAEPNFTSDRAPIRVTYFDKKTRVATKQFTYLPDQLSKKSGKNFAVNGVTSMLQLSKHQFLILEREYVAGYGTQGNNVRIYLADIANTTNTLNQNILNKSIFTAQKTLLFDFEKVRDQLTQNSIDNIEGMTFGPLLENGNLSLLLVADNNFNPPTEQLNQFLLLELLNYK